MGRPFLPSKLPIAMGYLDPHLTNGSLGPPESTDQNGISIGSVAVFAGLTTVTDTPRYSICNNKPHVAL